MTMPGQSPDIHSVYINGRKTSINLEPIFWDRLRSIAALEGVSMPTLLKAIDETMRIEPPRGRRYRNVRGLSSAVRCFVVEHSVIQIKR